MRVWCLDLSILFWIARVHSCCMTVCTICTIQFSLTREGCEFISFMAWITTLLIELILRALDLCIDMHTNRRPYATLTSKSIQIIIHEPSQSFAFPSQLVPRSSQLEPAGLTRPSQSLLVRPTRREGCGVRAALRLAGMAWEAAGASYSSVSEVKKTWN